MFMSVDPLADQFPGWNPYHYVHNNPIRLTDPTGMKAEDIIDIDKKTGNITVTGAAGDDVVILMDDGKVVDSYVFGSNGSFSCENTFRRGFTLEGTGISITSEYPDKANKLYKFAANSDVEFSILDTKEGISVIGTSGDEKTNIATNYIVHDLSKEGYTGKRISHSHPGTITSYNESVPSGHYKYEKGNPKSLMPFLDSDGRKVGDVLNAIKIKSYDGFSNTKLEVYAPGNKTTTTYDGVNRAKIRKN